MLRFNKEGAELYIPDGADMETAFKRTTCMAIAAHHDDIEIMAYHGILNCFGKEDEWFFGGLPPMAREAGGMTYTKLYRRRNEGHSQKEQKKSAYVGEYSAVAMLNYKSSEVKDPNNDDVVSELERLIKLARPRIIYTHNLADKHDTHVGVVTKVIKALRGLRKDLLPEKVYGCEVWRNLDWMNDNEKVVLDVSSHQNIAEAVLAVHDSQICGGSAMILPPGEEGLPMLLMRNPTRGQDRACDLCHGLDSFNS